LRTLWTHGELLCLRRRERVRKGGAPTQLVKGKVLAIAFGKPNRLQGPRTGLVHCFRDCMESLSDLQRGYDASLYHPLETAMCNEWPPEVIKERVFLTRKNIEIIMFLCQLSDTFKCSYLCSWPWFFLEISEWFFCFSFQL
jgi:hypothetical protein